MIDNKYRNADYRLTEKKMNIFLFLFYCLILYLQFVYYYFMFMFYKILLKWRRSNPQSHIHSFIQQIITQHILWASFCCKHLILLLVALNHMTKKVSFLALAAVATQRIERWPVKQRVSGSILRSGHMPGLQARSPVGGVQEVTTHWCFSPSVLLPSFPSKSK